jgi:hypothetical protein
MRCIEASEFVSALMDGETVPRDAAEHIGQCESCKALLTEYAEMGAELRREASLIMPAQASLGKWKTEKKIKSNFWEKGWQSMRIPRFAFALLLIAVVGLSSSLVLVKVRAQTQGPVLLLHIKTADRPAISCPLLIQGQHSTPCGSVMSLQSGMFVSGYRILDVEGSRVQLGVRTKLNPSPLTDGKGRTGSLDDVEGLPEAEYSFEPGEKLEVEGDRGTPIVVTGEYLDHMPTLMSGENNLDPEPDIMRIVSPVLLRDKKEVFDFEGFMGTANEKGQGIDIYTPQTGRYVLSLTPIPGAIEGKLRQSRISFQENGISYEFLMGVPVARGDKVWVLHEPDYKPSQDSASNNDNASFAGTFPLTALHRIPTTSN